MMQPVLRLLLGLAATSLAAGVLVLPEHESLASPPKVFYNHTLDIVLAHYAEDIPEMERFWQKVVNLPAMSWLSPKFYVYTQTTNNETLTALEQSWFADAAIGEVHRLDNYGREAHPYLWHVVRHYGHFPPFLLFHQAMPEAIVNVAGANLTEMLVQRIQRIRPNTGMLALSEAWTCTCQQCWGENPVQFREIWAMARQGFCVPDRQYATFLRAAFVVASRRVMAISKRTYAALYQYLEAPDDHWLHRQKGYGPEHHTADSPTLAHVIERLWNALFDCLDPDVVRECDACTDEACTPTACQCLEYPGDFSMVVSTKH